MFLKAYFVLAGLILFFKGIFIAKYVSRIDFEGGIWWHAKNLGQSLFTQYDCTV